MQRMVISANEGASVGEAVKSIGIDVLPVKIADEYASENIPWLSTF